MVEYGIWSQREEKIKRKRVVLVGKTVAERLANGREVMAELKKVLKAGSCIDPIKEVAQEADPDLILPTTPIRKAIGIYQTYCYSQYQRVL